jgi:nucleotide-binding universal stress UspA family protein
MRIQNIIFPVDFSDRSTAAAPFVQSMARRYDAAVHLIHAVPPLPALYFDVGSAYTEALDPAPITASLRTRLLDFGAEHFPHLDVTCAVVNHEPARAIIELASQNDADLIALPTHGYGGFRRALLGSVTAKILHDATIPVWTSAHCCEPSHRAHPQPRTIVVAVDRADESEHVLSAALEVARDAGASLEVLRLDPGGYTLETIPEAPGERVEPGEAIEVVVRRIALLKRADLVVVGRGHAHGGLIDRIRSHTYSVICESPCPVLSV